MRKKWAVFLGLLMTLAVLAAACGGGAQTATGPQGTAGPVPRPAATPTPRPGAPPAPRAATALNSASVSVRFTRGDAFSVAVTDRLIVRSANVSLAVKDVAEAAEGVARLAERLGGIVVSSSIQGNGEESRASVTIRVPVARFDEALAELRRLAVRVVGENTSSQDVTEEYVDLDARLRNLEATERQYLNLLDRATTVEDMLKVQRELSSVRGEIEQIRARLQYLERTAAMSLISVSLSPATNPKPLVEPGWSASETSKEAVRGLASTGQAIANGIIRVGVFSAIWLPVVVVVVAAGYLWRRRRHKGA